MFIYLNFHGLNLDPIRSTPSQVWTHAAIHEFADSQFGHLFARGEDREEARKTLVPGRKVLGCGGGYARMDVGYLKAYPLHKMWLFLFRNM